MDEDLVKKTALMANEIRKLALKMTSRGGSSHIASIFSIADILAVLYTGFLKVNPEKPKDMNRDRFILSKGHAGAGVYAALALRGFFDKNELLQHYQNGSIFSGHVSHKGIKGVEFSTGSLGHGLAVSVGMALFASLAKKNHKIVCLMSDGELDEGSNWESFLFAAHHSLNNLIVIIDKNDLQSIKSTSETLNLEPLREKLTAFNWDVLEIDGHDIQEIYFSLNKENNSSPKCIIANTTKGKGVKFMENNVLWHYRTARDKEYEMALKELNLISMDS